MQTELIKNEVVAVTEELLSVAKLKKGSVVVVGCSSSEVASQKIGTFSSEEIGQIIFDAFHERLKAEGIYLACQCCEHLNRALIIEEELADKLRLPIVNVVPQLKAGGSFATAAYKGFNNPVAVEEIKADAGIDVGDTLIGMHLKAVAVPVRIEQKTIGGAHVVCARTRPKFIGGCRAVYDEKLG